MNQEYNPIHFNPQCIPDAEDYFYDRLTGTYSRAFFETELKRLNTPRNSPLVLAVITVSDFQQTVAAYGRAEGDRLLKKIAAIIKKSCRADDIIARTGVDEFMILLPKTTPQQAEKITQRIHRRIDEHRCELELTGLSPEPETESRINPESETES